jgi:Ca2+-binding RTX toxin-like protein
MPGFCGQFRPAVALDPRRAEEPPPKLRDRFSQEPRMSTQSTVGDAGDNTLTGTAANEEFTGGKGSDTIVYRVGGGRDTLVGTYDAASSKIDTLQLNGIAPDALQFSRNGSDLLIGFTDKTTDGITVKMFFTSDNPDNPFNPLQQITFADANGNAPAAAIAPLLSADIIRKLTTGGSGADDLLGTALADTLVGGGGNDTLTGSKGNDEYQFNVGDGQDLISSTYDSDTSRVDTLRLGTKLASNDLSFSSTGTNGTSLLIRFAKSTDQITVENFLSGDKIENSYSPLQQITFADGGAALTATDILATLHKGTAGADNQHGTVGDDSITGLAGNDQIDGRAGNDTLVGGTGNDTLYGGSGNDDYYYTLGDGNDLIKLQSDASPNKINRLHLASGIVAADVSLTRSGTSLVIGIKASDTIPASTITVEYFSFTSGADNSFNPLQQIVFDGVEVTDAGLTKSLTWDLATLQANVMSGTAGGPSNQPTAQADLLTGTDGADTIIGGTGNDTINGGRGDDTYIFNVGDGQDTILGSPDTAAHRSDTLQLNGIAPANLLLSRSGSDLVIGFSGKSSDSITVKLFFTGEDPYNNYNPLQKITFMNADGSTPKPPVASLGIADLIRDMNTGGSGNDRLVGTVGNDTLVGGTGNDTLIGGKGDDVIDFSVGDGKDLITTLTGEPWSGRQDVLKIHGTDTLSFGTSGTSLVIQVITVTDTVTVTDTGTSISTSTSTVSGQITVDKFFYQDTPYNNYNPLTKIVFADGSPSLDVATILTALYAGTTEADALRGTSGADTIAGLAGNDTIDGRAGNDRIEGGAGNDLLDGGKGSDDYWFHLGDGQDTLLGVYDDTSGKINTLFLASGITDKDLKLTRSGSDLVISFNAVTTTNKESFTVKNFSFALNSDSSYNPLQAITFDGVTTGTDAKGNPIKLSWSLADIQGKVAGSGSSDSMTGDGKAQLLKGTDANDSIDGAGGNDTIDGGKGNDTYVFEMGDGSDELSLSRDTSVGRSDTLELKYLKSTSTEKGQFATFTRSGSDLIIGTPTVGDQITAKGFFLLNNPWGAYNPLQYVAFSDATVGIDWIVKQTNTGTSGNDKLVGTTGADTLIGGKGNDTLIGGKGDDVYEFNVGDGQDVITTDSSDTTIGRTDTLYLKDKGLSIDNLVLETSGSSLIITLTGDTTDQITVERFLDGDTTANKYNPLQVIEFDGDIKIELKAILAKLYAGTSGADSLRGTVDGDTISGGYGHDVLDGRGGNDTLTGGAGNDTLTGGSGDNVYDFAKGDGQDSLMGYHDTAQNKNNTLRLDGYTTADLVLTQLKGALIIEFNGVTKTNTDKITVNSFDFTGNGSDYSPLQSIYFTDSQTSWSGTAAVLDHLTGVVSKGDENDNRLSGGGGKDTLSGLDGDDTLIGLTNDDDLTGGLGDDLINGGLGDDTYHFNKGDGQDTLVGGGDAGDINTLAFGDDVASTDLVLTRMGTSLVIYLDKADTGNTDQITVEDFSFSTSDGNTSSPLQTITVGGATWDLDTIRGKVGGVKRIGDGEANTLYGADLKDTLTGGAGNDTLYGYDGNDVLTGGTGDDMINGGAGDDTYKYSNGDGNDTLAGSTDSNTAVNNTLAFGTLSPSDMALTRIGTSLVIYVNLSYGNNDHITVEDFSFSAGDGNTSNPLQTIDWSGTSFDWNLARIRSEVSGVNRDGNDEADTVLGGDLNDTLAGADGDDTLVAYDGNDDLTGGTGNDSLIGGDGDDMYHFSPGDGGDTIVDSGGTDTLFVSAYTGCMFFKEDGDDLEIYLYGTAASDTAEIIRIEDWYQGADHQIESIAATSFGTTLTLSSNNVAALVTAMANFHLPATTSGLPTVDGYDDVQTAINTYWKS